jgi:hypothetical protein
MADEKALTCGRPLLAALPVALVLLLAVAVVFDQPASREPHHSTVMRFELEWDSEPGRREPPRVAVTGGKPPEIQLAPDSGRLAQSDWFPTPFMVSTEQIRWVERFEPPWQGSAAPAPVALSGPNPQKIDPPGNDAEIQKHLMILSGLDGARYRSP